MKLAHSSQTFTFAHCKASERLKNKLRNMKMGGATASPVFTLTLVDLAASARVDVS
jgi:hypothetical protein